MFCKSLLRRATLDELKLLPRSTLQFVGIQLVVFVTNFQSTLLNILAQTGVLKPDPAWGFKDEFAFASMLQVNSLNPSSLVQQVEIRAANICSLYSGRVCMTIREIIWNYIQHNGGKSLNN